MTRRKRASIILQQAEKRAAGLSSISPSLDLGDNLSLPDFTNLIEMLRDRVSSYNTALAHVDDLAREIKFLEGQVSDTSERMLLGVGARYGKKSREYGKAGGTPKTEYRRSTRKTTFNSDDSTDDSAERIAS